MQTAVNNRGFQAYAGPTYEPLKEEMEVLAQPLPQGVAVTSTVVNVGAYGTPPRDHNIWSLFNSMYMNFCGRASWR